MTVVLESASDESNSLEVPAEGVGGFTQSWFPVCYSGDVANGQVTGREFVCRSNVEKLCALGQNV